MDRAGFVPRRVQAAVFDEGALMPCLARCRLHRLSADDVILAAPAVVVLVVGRALLEVLELLEPIETILAVRRQGDRKRQQQHHTLRTTPPV